MFKEGDLVIYMNVLAEVSEVQELQWSGALECDLINPISGKQIINMVRTHDLKKATTLQTMGLICTR